jgi:cell division protein FtsB
MKRIRKSINLVLSAIIVALGFGSCVSQQKYRVAQEEIKQLHEQNSRLSAENDALHQENANLRNALKHREQTEQRKVVYGPRPTGFKEKINQ